MRNQGRFPNQEDKLLPESTETNAKLRKLLYRGVAYQSSVTQVETLPGAIGGLYRGQPWRSRLLNLSCCCLCKHYQLTGRRGGFCEKLNVPVKGTWTTCSLAESPFATGREAKDGV